MRKIDSQGDNIVLMKEEVLVNLVSLAYINGHNDTVDNDYYDPREVLDHILDLIEEQIKEGRLSIHELSNNYWRLT